MFFATKIVKINIFDFFDVGKKNFGKMVFLRVKKFDGLHDDLKIIRKKLTPGRYPVQKI